MKKNYINPECDILILENIEETLVTVSSEMANGEKSSSIWTFEV